MEHIGEGSYQERGVEPEAPAPEDNIVIVKYNGHTIIYSLDGDNMGVGEFEGQVPAWAKAMGILHALRHILEVKELESILSVACARMRSLKRCISMAEQNAQLGGMDRG